MIKSVRRLWMGTIAHLQAFRLAQVYKGLYVMFQPLVSNVWTTNVLVANDRRQLQQLEVQSKYGTLRFGLDPRDGHAGWRFQHGGGSILLPYAIGAKLYVGLLPEVRPNLGPGEHLCVVGGFKRPTETHADAARRETAAEAGAIVDPVRMPGLPGAMDRNYFEVDISSDQGLKAYSIEVPMREMMEAENGSLTHPQWSVRGQFVRFCPWRDAVLLTPDTYARAAIAQLLATLPHVY